ncbi:glycoside hydrolase family 18 protein [Prolixibacteraceae bacterium Z1-6]|uniref:chitinase n=1 Tax=Draconibacterium aestuarii TaxID=2998507 RepID=A0A9X3F6A7_9BACT|nr:glycoside hydrolase family 18 protein [Prolixibacteraceae bacterium Z1-6]
MNKIIAFVFIVTAFFSCNQKQNTSTINDSPVNIMAYYVPERDYHPEQLPLNKLTHIIFSFSKVIEGEMQFRNEESGKKLQLLVEQSERYPNLKVMIACGGWGADGFSDAALTQESRAKFVKSAVAFIEKYQLDGMDVDWEYPGISGAGTKARPDVDKQNFTALMKLLREELDKLDRPQTLTFASAGWERYYTNVEMLEVLKYADFMNVMTYDQVGANNPVTAHHTAFGNVEYKDIAATPLGKMLEARKERYESRGIKFGPRSVERIIDYCISNGADPKQLVVGAAFYGRAWKGVEPENNGLYQPNKGSYIGWSAYHQIREKYENKNGFTRYWDELAKAPYLFNPTDSIFISFDDTMSVKIKTRYSMDKNLGGIMFWELSNDTKEENSLLDAIFEEATR